MLVVVTAVLLTVQVPVDALVAQENCPPEKPEHATKDGLAPEPAAAQFPEPPPKFVQVLAALHSLNVAVPPDSRAYTSPTEQVDGRLVPLRKRYAVWLVACA